MNYNIHQEFKKILKSLKHITPQILVFLLVLAWIFSGWPQIWQNPRIPPEVKEAKAAFGTGGAVCNASAKAAGTSLSCTVGTENLDAGNIAVLIFGGDNVATADGNDRLLYSVTDSKSNDWIVERCFTNGQGGAAAGATTCIAWSKIKNTLVSGTDTITANFLSITAKAIRVKEFTVPSQNIFLSVVGAADLANDAVDPGAMTLSGLANKEHLFVRLTALERAAGGTWTPTTNFTTFGCSGTTGGGAATNMEICGEFRIFTGTSLTSDPTGTAVDSASIFIAFDEVSPFFNQSAYRFFNNLDSTAVGTPLANQNASTTLSSTGQAFRLRQLIHTATSSLSSPFWINSTVEAVNSVGQYTSITAIDANTIFISHYDFTNGDLRFCKSTNGGTTWTCSAAETLNDVGAYSSITAIDANTIFISHHDATPANQDLRFCKSTNGGSTWTCSAVDTLNTVGIGSSITAIDANTIFISHRDFTNGDLRFCKSTNGGTTWTCSAVDTLNDVGYYTSIKAIDANTIFISHYDQTNGDLRFCKSTNGGTTWTCSAVDTLNNVGAYSSITAIDANTIFISHFDTTNAGLRFCKSTDGGSTWTCSAVDTLNNVGYYTSIKAIDANTIFISHYDSTNGDLRFCKSTDGGSTWTCSAVDTLNNVGYYTSITAIDANTIFISYYDITNVDLRFAKAKFQTFKLQFAQRGTDNLCDTSFTGETYADVTTSTVIAFNDNPTPTDNSSLTADTTNDPTHGADAIDNQTYEELNPFTNLVSTINAGEDGKWDFSLKDNGATSSTAYCLRAVKNDGTLLDTYTVIPQITTAAASGITCSLSATSTSFSALSPSAVSTSSPDITITISSGAGFQINVKDAGNGTSPGLYKSTTSTYLISSADATLSAGTDGYGIQSATTTAGSGGIITLNPKYNKTGNDVGGLSLTDVQLASSTTSVTNREIIIKHKAAVSFSAPSGSYSDTITYTCSAQ
jgi:hypothetical protein